MRSSLPEPATSEFEIIGRDGTNYFIKLLAADSGREVMAIYVEGSSKLTVPVPRGTFRLRYASGAVWYGERELFGASTTLTAIFETFTFEPGWGHGIDLRRRLDGNLTAIPITASGF